MSKSNSPRTSNDHNNQKNINLESHLSNFSSKEAKEQSSDNPVAQAKHQLDNLIQNLNGKLVNHFKMKQQSLLEKYKQELIEQQRQLTELKNNTNQEQIRNKMLQRKSELEKQRNHLIQTNMFFSQKCQQYKQTYSKLVQDGEDLHREIKFLDQQIETANSKKISMIEEIEKSQDNQTDRSQLPMFTEKKKYVDNEYTDRKNNEGTTMEKSKQSNSVRKIAKSLHVTKFSKNTKSGQQIKNPKSINPQIFEKGLLEKLFEESVQQVKNRRKTKRTMPNLKGEEFTEYEKRAIMEIFLSNEDVKKKIYEIIFENNDKAGKGLRADPLIKISFEEIGM